VADEIRLIDYYYVSVPDKPGEAARILSALHQAGASGVSRFSVPHSLLSAFSDLYSSHSPAPLMHGITA
jgi:hypothetical protein